MPCRSQEEIIAQISQLILNQSGHGVDKPSRWQSGDQSDQRFVVVVVVSVATGAGTE
jgi:hypothetical protein